jgi:hypothetical protein
MQHLQHLRLFMHFPPDAMSAIFPYDRAKPRSRRYASRTNLAHPSLTLRQYFPAFLQPNASRRYWLAPAGLSLAAVAGAATAGPVWLTLLATAASLALPVGDEPVRLQPDTSRTAAAARIVSANRLSCMAVNSVVLRRPSRQSRSMEQSSKRSAWRSADSRAPSGRQ